MTWTYTETGCSPLINGHKVSYGYITFSTYVTGGETGDLSSVFASGRPVILCEGYDGYVVSCAIGGNTSPTLSAVPIQIFEAGADADVLDEIGNAAYVGNVVSNVLMIGKAY